MNADRLVALTPDGDVLTLLDDGDPERVAEWDRHFAAGTVTPEILGSAAGTLAPMMASVTFGGPDLRTVYLGPDGPHDPDLPVPGPGAAAAALEGERRAGVTRARPAAACASTAGPRSRGRSWRRASGTCSASPREARAVPRGRRRRAADPPPRTRHESSAAWMAAATFHATGRLAACYGEMGPGAHNLVGGLGTARANGLAVLVLDVGAADALGARHAG